MACSHAGGWHSQRGRCHVGHWAVGQPIRHSVRQVAVVRRWWRFVIEDPKFILLGLKIFVAIGTHFAIRAGFVCAAVSGKVSVTPRHVHRLNHGLEGRLTEQDYQTERRPSGSAGRHMVALECGFSHV